VQLERGAIGAAGVQGGVEGAAGIDGEHVARLEQAGQTVEALVANAVVGQVRHH
jgi:hypothetical protein